MKRIIIFSIVLCFIKGLIAQSNYVEGFIITPSLDTISGLINFQDQVRTPQYIKFKNELNAKPKKYSPSQLSAFVIQNQKYTSRVVSIDKTPQDIKDLKYNEDYFSDPIFETDTMFLKAMVQGEANLYYIKDEAYKDHFYIENDSILDELIFRKYLKKVNGKELIQRNERYKGQLSYYFRDCEKLKNRIKVLDYEKKSMIKIFDSYNNCNSKEKKNSIISDTTESKLKLKFSILGGASLSTLVFHSSQYYLQDLDNADFGYSVKPTAGISLNIIFPKRLNKWSLYNELRYHAYKLESETEKQIGVNLNKYEYQFNYAYLKFAIMMRYKLNLKNFQPFFGGGFVNSFAIKTDDSRKSVEYSYSTTNTTEKEVFSEPRKHEQGWILGVGVQYKKLSFEFRFERANGMSDYTAINSVTYSYVLLLGYTF